MGWVVTGCLAVDASWGRVETAASKQRVAAGAAIFHQKGCEFCHGVSLAGTERAPDLSAVGKRRTRGYMEQQIRGGGGGMPAFGEILTGDEVGLLVDFLGSERKQGPVNAGAMAVPVEKK